MDVFARRGNIMRLHGIDAELLDRSEVEKVLPYLDYSKDARWPIHGAIYQPRAGTVRHDAVAWGYARAASQLGVHIIENCEVTAILNDGDKVTGVETTRGKILADKVGMAVAGHSSHVAAMAGLRLPIESHILQAFVSEPDQADRASCRVVGGGAVLHVAIRQGRPGVWWPYRWLQHLHPTRPIRPHPNSDGMHLVACTLHTAVETAAALGRHHGHDAGWLTLHLQNA